MYICVSVLKCIQIYYLIYVVVVYVAYPCGGFLERQIAHNTPHQRGHTPRVVVADRREKAALLGN